MRWIAFPASLLALALAGCSTQSSDSDKLAQLDKQLANETDPAVTTALADPITVDPALTQQSNKLAVRPAPMPAQALYPPLPGGGRTRTNGQPGARSSATPLLASAGNGNSCGSAFQYDASWSRRLPPELPLYPGARLTDAAGDQSGDCRLRVATFLTQAAPQQVLAFYQAKATGAGFSAEHRLRDGDQILAGARDRDGGAYYLIVTPKGSGSDVALIANHGV